MQKLWDTKYIVANWKSNKNQEELLSWLKIVGPISLKASKQIKIVVAPSFIYLDVFNREIKKNNYQITLCAQNVSPFEYGPYTGEVTALQLKDFVDYVIVGHSERVGHFSEQPKQINQKIRKCLENNLVPIVCISDEVLKEHIQRYILDFNKENLKKVIFMYEPPGAISKPVGPIGLGTAAQSYTVLSKTKQLKEICPESLIFYGGSVKSDNIKSYLDLEGIDGVLVGSASLNAEEFVKIILHASKI